ncbi:MAG: hypothetical protein IKO69_02730, partial [Acidaminococcaceae bacterium]|nr:hypothetical protein [Acidaminococcaceae bacterium]
YLDVTDNKPGIELAVDIARDIKRRIKEQTRLTASAGVSYCKFLAKVASDYRKPDGLCTVHPDRALDFIAGLKIEQFWGVGEKTAARMHALGIHTGADLRQKPLSLLTAHFGKMGSVFYNFARGIISLIGFIRYIFRNFCDFSVRYQHVADFIQFLRGVYHPSVFN